MRIEEWGFSRGARNELLIGGVSAVDLARSYGTPLHVVDEALLRQRARILREAFEREYPEVDCFYALKCNSVPGVVAMIFAEGLGAAVMSEFEFWLARRLGMQAHRILLNGPNKSKSLLRQAVTEGIGALVVDSIAELERLERIADECRTEVQVLLRVNPGFTPHGLNSVSAEASRKGSALGLDPAAGETIIALNQIRGSKFLRYAGLHAHIGSGIRHPEDYARAFKRIAPVFLQARAAGLHTRIFDFGGGFGSSTTKELTNFELLRYQAWGRLPGLEIPSLAFAPPICAAIKTFVAREGLPLPRLYLEPGRTIASPAQLLLLTVGTVKHRPGADKWVITDGGAGTCASPLYYEYHEVVLADDVSAVPVERVNLIGPAFAAHWIYRNKAMPVLRPGHVIAILDSGAYFLALEANFGFPRTAVVAVCQGHDRVIRRRESFEDMVSRDLIEPSLHGHTMANPRVTGIAATTALNPIF